MQKRLKHLTLTIITCFVLVLLAIGSAEAPVRAQQPEPLSHSPRLALPQNWASADYAAAGQTSADFAPEIYGSQSAAAGTRRPDRGYWTRTTFQAGVGNNWEIFLHDGSAPNQVRILASSLADDYNPKLTHGADKVVFVSQRDGNAEIYRVNSDGTGLLRLTNNRAADAQPDWSPDGQKVVFVSNRNGSPALYMMNSNGSNVQQLTQSGDWDLNPDWSPDGKQIAWVRVNTQNNGQIMVMNADGGNQHSITRNLIAPDRVAWSDSGEMLAVDTDIDADGWIDIGYLRVNSENFPHNVCVLKAGADCWLGGWYADDEQLLYSGVTFVTQSGQVYIEKADFNRVAIFKPGYAAINFFPYGTNLTAILNADAQLIDRTLPVSQLLPISRYSRVNRIALQWIGYDPGQAKICNYYVYANNTLNSDTWAQILGPETEGTDWIEGITWEEILQEDHPHQTVLPSGDNPVSGLTIYLASRARDVAGNMEPLHSTPDTFTTTYTVLTKGLVTDNRGLPIQGLAVKTVPAAINVEAVETNGSGQFNTYHSTNTLQAFQVESSPSITTQLDQDRTVQIVLQPNTNALTNGSFDSSLEGWQISGKVLADASGHSGQAARLGPSCPDCQSAQETFSQPFSSSMILVDSQNYVHTLVNTTEYWLRDPQGNWTKPDQPFGLPDNITKIVMRLDNQDALHVLYRTNSGMVYVQKPKNGYWTNIEYPKYSGTIQPFSIGEWMDIDQQGQVHVVYGAAIQNSNTNLYYYTRRGLNGQWSVPVQVAYASFGALAAAPDGGAYLFYNDKMQHISPVGTLEQPVWLKGCVVKNALSDNKGRVHVFCYGNPSAYQVLDVQGNWITEQYFPDFITSRTFWGSFFSRDGSAVFHSVDELNHDNIHLMFKQPSSEEFNHFDYNVGYTGFSLAASKQTGLHIAISDMNGVEYSRSQTANEPENDLLSQTITIPTDLYKPTLSFLYKIEGPAQLTDSGLTVSITSQGSTNNPLFNEHTVGTWQHKWMDLSQWAGQTVTLTFQYHQAAGEPVSSLLLDEINVGPWETPIIQSLSPSQLGNWVLGERAVTIHGSNFREGATVLVAEQVIPTTFISDSELVATLPDSLKLGFHNLRVVNPSGMPSNTVSVLLGHQVLLPVIRK